MKNLLFISILTIFIACGSQTNKTNTAIDTLVKSNIKHVDWAKNAVIYEVNIRQYTSEGTFKAFIPHISRLKELGVDILWLMPIHPIGEKNRKGSLGSYYSVKDYTAVNPEYGSLDDFKTLVNAAHEQGMHVLIDWVANHTAWDNKWINEHPNWYSKDSLGNFYGPFDWSDVAQLNYEVPELHDAMIDALEYWVKETDIDGYRCDVAGMVPVEFWNKARIALDKIKPVFMLAEDEQNTGLVENAFDMNYSWHLHHIMNQIAKGEENIRTLKDYYTVEDSVYPKSVYRMNFITNHDENSWNGTEFERMGDGVKSFAVMSFTIPGMPLIYTGQEVGLSKRLDFFEKNEVDWSRSDLVDFYKNLIKLKKENKVFWNGTDGGDFEMLCANNKHVFVFKRFSDKDEAYMFLNLSDKEQEIIIPKGISGAFNNYFGDNTILLNEGEKTILAPWSYQVLLK